MHTAATFRTRAEAEVAVGMLRSRGITARLLADDAGGIAPHVQLVVGSYEVQVPVGEVEDARQLLEGERGAEDTDDDLDRSPPSFAGRNAKMRLVARCGVGALGVVVVITLIQSVLL